MEIRKVSDWKEKVLLELTFCCRGLCDRLKTVTVPNYLRYELGHKRCTLCAVFVEKDNFRCPCCGARLRTKSRNKKHHEDDLLINNVKHALNTNKSNND